MILSNKFLRLHIEPSNINFHIEGSIELSHTQFNFEHQCNSILSAEFDNI